MDVPKYSRTLKMSLPLGSSSSTSPAYLISGPPTPTKIILELAPISDLRLANLFILTTFHNSSVDCQRRARKKTKQEGSGVSPLRRHIYQKLQFLIRPKIRSIPKENACHNYPFPRRPADVSTVRIACRLPC